MPKQVIRYLCNICGNEYNTAEEALDCEALPTEPQHYKEGDWLSYDDETRELGVRYCYTYLIGIVLLAYNTRHCGENGSVTHRWGYIVRPNAAVPHECVVYEVTEDGITKLVSPHDYKFQPGYAGIVRNQRLNDMT